MPLTVISRNILDQLFSKKFLSQEVVLNKKN